MPFNARPYLLAGLLAIAGCEAPISQYRDLQPALVPEEFFSGELSAHGVVKNFKGSVIRSFNADIQASWKNDVGTLDENFTFNDGEKQRRVWTLTPTENANEYIGTASPDVIGEGKVRLSGNAMFLKYTLRIPYKNSTLDVTVDDKMYLTHPNVIVNESKLLKWGVPVGSVLLTIIKDSEKIKPQ